MPAAGSQVVPTLGPMEPGAGVEAVASPAAAIGSSRRLVLRARGGAAAEQARRGVSPGRAPTDAPVVRVDIWGVPSRSVPAAFAAMAHDRGIRRRPGVQFAKLLGTGNGRTFTARDADVHHWALLTCSPDRETALGLDADPVLRRWADRSEEHLRLLLDPLSSRGTWSGREPFGRPAAGARPRWDGPVVAITRARLRLGHLRRFWAAVPPVSASLHTGDGPALAVGIGEAPVGLQGTLSVWSDPRTLQAWAYRRPEHLAAVRATPVENWYAEELFARFRLVNASGTFERRELASALSGAAAGPAPPLGRG